LETPQRDKFTQSRILVWAHNNVDIFWFLGPYKWAKAHGGKLEFGRFQKRINAPTAKFDFVPLNTKDSSGPLKLAKAPGVRFGYGRIQKRTISPKITIGVYGHKNCGCFGLVAPKI
jgi:hypothetical protein